MLKEFLFETNVGNYLLTALEKHTGLALVDAEWLAQQIAPMAVNGNHQGSGVELLQPFTTIEYTIIDPGPQP